MGCHFLLQGIFLTQELNLSLLHYRQILNHLSHKVNPEQNIKTNENIGDWPEAVRKWSYTWKKLNWGGGGVVHLQRAISQHHVYDGYNSDRKAPVSLTWKTRRESSACPQMENEVGHPRGRGPKKGEPYILHTGSAPISGRPLKRTCVQPTPSSLIKAKRTAAAHLRGDRVWHLSSDHLSGCWNKQKVDTLQRNVTEWTVLYTMCTT